MWAAQEEAHACDADFEPTMCHRSGPRAPGPVPEGPYREHRRGLVMWIANKANRFQLKTITIHYATNYLDRCAHLLCASRVDSQLSRLSHVWLNVESDYLMDYVCAQGNAFVAFASRQVSRHGCLLPAHRSEIRGQFDPPPFSNPALAPAAHPAFPAFLLLSPVPFACAHQ
jgi:hypothetical protein